MMRSPLYLLFTSALLLVGFTSGKAVSDPLSVCNLCSTAVDTVSLLVKEAGLEINRENLLNTFHLVCKSIPEEIGATDECEDFVTLWGSYVVDLALSYPDSTSVCGDAGLCGQDPKYSVLMPSFENGEVVYDYTQDIDPAQETYYFKVFVGNVTLNGTDDDSLTHSLFLSVTPSEGWNAAFAVNKESASEVNYDCKQATKCEILVMSPDINTWYYINVGPQKVSDVSNGQFGLHVVEKMADIQLWTYSYSLALFFFMLLLLAVSIKLSIFCCCVNMLRNKRRKDANQEEDSEDQHTNISLDEMEEETIVEAVPPSAPFPHPQPAPFMYYYPQNGQAGPQYFMMQPQQPQPQL